MSGYDEIKRNIAKMIEKGKNSASTSDATYYDKETRRYYSESDIKKLKEINEVKLAEIESLKYYGVSDNDGKITSRETDIKTNEGVIKRLEEYFGIDAERKEAYNDVMNLIYNDSDNELWTDDSISFSSSISTLSDVTETHHIETEQLNNSNVNNTQQTEQPNNTNVNNPQALEVIEAQNTNVEAMPTEESIFQQSDNLDAPHAEAVNPHQDAILNYTLTLGEGEQQNANTDTIQVAETSEHENNNNNLTRSSTLLQVSDNRNNLDRIGYGQHSDTGTLSRRKNVLDVSDNWAVSPFYNGPSPAKKDVTKLKKFGNFIKRTFKIN